DHGDGKRIRIASGDCDPLGRNSPRVKLVREILYVGKNKISLQKISYGLLISASARPPLELVVRDPLGLGRLLQIFHALQVHLLAELVETLDQGGIRADAHVLALLYQELLVNKVAQYVLLALGFLGRSV